jgi:2-polyprenyl-3-methyl-5-hydroxy-6-metoxy-1,4-benzoquinol methylase
MDGRIHYAEGVFDLLTCFGVLHHIPNVSTLVSEFYRCLAPDGYALVREPVISMGDWREPRPGLTKRERGIPLGILRNTLREAGFTIVRETLCMFSVTQRLGRILRESPFNCRAIVRWDRLASRLFAWNLRYHATNVLQKLRPVAVFYVLRKRTSGRA